MGRLLMTITWVCFLFTSVLAQDPGVADTVRVGGDTLFIGQSRPVGLFIVNDEEVAVFQVPLILTSVDGGFAVFDSAVWVNRMGDPWVLDMRFVSAVQVDGVSPDTLIISALRTGWPCLPPGSDAVIELYFTGLSEGKMYVDSGFAVPANYLLMSTCAGEEIEPPQFVGKEWTIIEAPLPPVMTLQDDVIRVSAGTPVIFEVDAESPGGSEVSLDIESFTGYDAPATPSESPTLTGSPPGTFEWQTTLNDVGIWKANISACDTDDICASAAVVIQVVQNGSYLATFDVTASAETARFTRVALGNFDDDLYPELAASSFPAASTHSSVSLWDYDVGVQTFQLAEEVALNSYVHVGMEVGYITEDEALDVISTELEPIPGPYITVWQGGGDNSLELLTESRPAHWQRGAVLTELTGDQYLDYAVAALDELVVHESDAGHAFSILTTIAMSDSILTVNSADFNQDGHGDLAAGTKLGVQMYLNDGAGGFAAGEFYPQVYGATGIEVTNQGSDFNNDNLYDLCVSTPSIGATFSEIAVYLGNGDGSFEPRLVRTVVGYVLGNCIADFNNDNELDIAYVNGGERS
ncbi:MAG: VCBS repeat-containing protein, partial [Candidatus Zixiibacteriota bacterium]